MGGGGGGPEGEKRRVGGGWLVSCFAPRSFAWARAQSERRWGHGDAQRRCGDAMLPARRALRSLTEFLHEQRLHVLARLDVVEADAVIIRCEMKNREQGADAQGSKQRSLRWRGRRSSLQLGGSDDSLPPPPAVQRQPPQPLRRRRGRVPRGKVASLNVITQTKAAAAGARQRNARLLSLGGRVFCESPAS